MTNHLIVNKKKCVFKGEHIKHLGHIVSKKGMKTNLKKIQDMKDWLRLRDLRELKGFLGYYQRFVKGYRRIAKPLTNLLKKNAFK